MADIDKKIKELEELIKGLKANIESSSVLPSIKQSKLQGVKAPSSSATKLPGISPKSKKSPVKQAEQIKNADIKDMKMREAREALNVNKSTGQWSIETLEDFGKPFRSEAQRRWMWAAAERGEIPKDMPHRWAKETPKDKKLPYKVEKEEKPQVPKDKYHIHVKGLRITKDPMTLKEIHEKHGGVKRLEGAGYRLHPVKDKS